MGNSTEECADTHGMDEPPRHELPDHGGAFVVLRGGSFSSNSSNSSSSSSSSSSRNNRKARGDEKKKTVQTLLNIAFPFEFSTNAQYRTHAG